MNVFTRARAGLNLTPGERAFLRLVDLCVLAGLVAALPVISDALANQPVNWSAVLHTAIAAFGVAALGALLKWLKAQTDAPLPTPVAVRAPRLPSFQTMQDTGVVTTATPAPSSASVGATAAAASGAGDTSVTVTDASAPAAS